jgi:hypothetical protein
MLFIEYTTIAALKKQSQEHGLYMTMIESLLAAQLYISIPMALSFVRPMA